MSTSSKVQRIDAATSSENRGLRAIYSFYKGNVAIRLLHKNARKAAYPGVVLVAAHCDEIIFGLYLAAVT